MIVNLNLEHENSINCYLDQINVVAKKHQKNIFKSFIPESLFCYNKDMEKIGDRITSSFDLFKSMEDYSGVKIVNEFIYNINDFFTLLESKLLIGIPLIGHIDTYYYKWSSSYNKMHSMHSFLINGINRDEKNIIISDAFYSIENDIITFDDIENYINSNILSNKFTYLEISDDINLTNEDIIEKLYFAYENKTFEALQLFIGDIKTGIYIEKELEINSSFENDIMPIIFSCPLITSLYDVAQTRERIAKLLRESKSNNMDTIIYYLEILSSNWKIIRNIIMKNFVKYYKSSNLFHGDNNLNFYLDKVKSEEFELYQILKRYKNNEVMNYQLTKNFIYNLEKCTEIYRPNIKLILNNIAFLNLQNNFNDICYTNVYNGNKEFFIYSEESANNLRVPYLANGSQKMDNIKCNFQKIKINTDKEFDFISFLIHSETEDNRDIIKIIYCDGTTELLFINTLNFAYHADNIENYAYFFDLYSYQNEKLLFSGAKGPICRLNYNINKPISEICLPNNDSLHIFDVCFCVKAKD